MRKFISFSVALLCGLLVNAQEPGVQMLPGVAGNLLSIRSNGLIEDSGVSAGSFDIELIIDDERWVNESDKDENRIEYESEYPGGDVYTAVQTFDGFRTTGADDAYGHLYARELHLGSDEVLANDGTGSEGFIDYLDVLDNGQITALDDLNLQFNTLDDVGHIHMTQDDIDYIDIDATGECDFEFYKGVGLGIMDFRILCGDFTSPSSYRFGLSTGSTGDNDITLFSPNSSAKNHRLGCGNTSYMLADDAMPDNNRVVIIGSNSKASNDTLLEIDAGGKVGAFLLPRMTTTERNTMSGLNGMMIWNETTGTVQVYDGSWTSL